MIFTFVDLSVTYFVAVAYAVVVAGKHWLDAYDDYVDGSSCNVPLFNRFYGNNSL